MGLRKATVGTTKLELSDGDFLEVLSDISKRTFNQIIGITPVENDGTFTVANGLTFQTRLFGILVKGWSLPDAVTEEAYLDLSRESAEEIDAALSKHFESLTVTETEATKSVRSGETSSGE